MLAVDELMSSGVIPAPVKPREVQASPRCVTLWGWQWQVLLNTWYRHFWLLYWKHQQPGKSLLTSGQLLEVYFIPKLLHLCAVTFEKT